jgi:hypothetical protein
MSEHPCQLLSPETAERAIILQLLREDHDERWTRAELLANVNIEASALEIALDDLIQSGVLVTSEDHVLASRCARRLDKLGYSHSERRWAPLSRCKARGIVSAR